MSRTKKIETPGQAIEQIKSRDITRQLFSKNLSTETVHIKSEDEDGNFIEGSTLAFVVQYLSDGVLNYIRMKAQDEDGTINEINLSNLMIKFGLVGIHNPDQLTYEDGEVIEFKADALTILGKAIPCCADIVVEQMRGRRLKNELVSVISELSELTTPQSKRLEFFRSGS